MKYLTNMPNHRKSNRFLIVLMCVIVVLHGSNKAHADDEFEAKLKTAYLVNIARFTTWSSNNDDKVLCIFKESAIFNEINQLKEIKSEPGFKLVINVDPVNLNICNLLYLDDDTFVAEQNQILEQMYRGTLTISDMNNAIELGFAIQFFVRNLKLRFSINQEVIKSGDYKVSSKLLRLSRQMD